MPAAVQIVLGLFLLATLGQAINVAVQPHILFIVADDLGK